ncbi:MAG: DUF5107 domain-containing protein [Tannerella sp.]|jgi:hypothetical protein|nr:DUF5107 domain-containing protein [Tannerella sp.]
MRYICCFLFLLVVAGSNGQVASVREEILELNTYPFGDPNPVANPEYPVYPYFGFEKYSDEGETKDWPCVVLENDYIEVTVIPSQGGKIWGAVEKRSGEHFIYFNHAAKFRSVAWRGPWTSGGIEFNFGLIGHVPTTATPVDYYTRENGDGSVSCFVGALELATHTSWQMEINLRPDRAYFTTHTTFYNTTPVTRPYYHWMNAAYRAADDLELYFPGQYHIGHGGDAHAWPIDDQGRDLSKYANNNFGPAKSYHVLGNLSDFYAAYYTRSQSGSVHHAPYDEKPGMKIWIWGLSRSGMIWENLLSDTDGQYVELQSGRLYNQAVASGSSFTPFLQSSFEPYATDVWTEYWYPVKETGGVAKANEYGALNVVRGQDGCTLAFCPVQKIADEIVVTAGGKEIFREQLSLNVLETWKTDIGRVRADAELKIVLGDQKLVYSEAPADNRLSRPVVSPEDFNPNSVYGLYMQGQQALYANRLKDADSLLSQSLKEEPYAIPALRDLATVYYRRGLFEKADSLARVILSVNAYDAEGNLLYGLANSSLGRSTDAMDGFSMASLSPSRRVAAYILLAKEYARKQLWKQVLAYSGKALSSDAKNMDALLLEMLAYRKLGQPGEAGAIIEKVGRDYPLNHTARFEKYLQTGNEQDKKAFTGLIRNELPHETLMEIAGWYESAGCNEEAIELYGLSPDYPVALIRAAFLLSKQGKESRSLLERAASLPTRLVFPSRTETLPALEWAVTQLPNWKNRYYLGLLHDFLGSRAEAIEQFEKCGNEPDDYTFYLTRAQYREGQQKEKDLLEAERLGETWRAGLALIKYYEQAQQYGKMHEYAAKYAKRYSGYDVIGLKYASSLLYLKQYRKASDYLSRMVVLPGEGGVEGYLVYRRAWIYQALESAKAGNCKKALSHIEKAKEWPEHLGAGKPYDEDIDSRAEDSLSAYCYQKLNNRTKADEYRDRVKVTNERLKDAQEEMYRVVLREMESFK